MTAETRDTAALLRSREVLGLRWFIGAQIVGIAALGLGIVLFVTNPNTVFNVPVVVAIALALLSWLFWVTGRSDRLLGIGLAAGVIALCVTGPIPFLEWVNAAGDPVAAAYLPKTGFPMGIAIIALSALTLNPRHPLIMTGLVLAYQVFLVILAVLDDQTVYASTATWEEHVMGPALHLGKTANQLAFVVGTGLIVSLIAWTARRTVRAGVTLEKVNGDLRRYFAPEVASRIAEGDQKMLRQGGQVRDVVVLASDLKGFTAFSESLEPNQVVAVLAEYRSAMTKAIFEHGGSIDKFIGDGILATFGALRVQPDAAGRSVRAAQAMTDALTALNAARAERGEVPLEHRIGLHAGPALVGNVGGSDRLEFTVIGDVVNVATRIEEACKTTGDGVLMSDAVLKGAPDTPVVSRGRPELRGVGEPPELYALG